MHVVCISFLSKVVRLCFSSEFANWQGGFWPSIHQQFCWRQAAIFYHQGNTRSAALLYSWRWMICKNPTLDKCATLRQSVVHKPQQAPATHSCATLINSCWKISTAQYFLLLASLMTIGFADSQGGCTGFLQSWGWRDMLTPYSLIDPVSSICICNALVYVNSVQYGMCLTYFLVCAVKIAREYSRQRLQ